MSQEPPDGFPVDVEGLLDAVRRLVSARRASGSPHPAPATPPYTGWPQAGLGERAALELLAPQAIDTSTRLDHRGFLAHMDPPTPWVTWAAALWAVAANQNLLHPDTAPQARQLERDVVGWLAPEFGMAGGQIVPGSTLGNLTGLWAARELTGADTVVASTAAHISVRKAANLLAMNFVAVPVDDDQRIRTDQLPQDLSRCALVLTAGTTGVGAVDPLDAGRGAAWRHVDAAWAGPLRLTTHAGVLDGIDTADSISVSTHKWLYQPKESALIMWADPARAEAALTYGGAYLAAPNIGLLGSHGAAALPLAATLLAWGRDGLAAHIEADMRRADELARLVVAEPGFELWHAPTTGITIWRPAGTDPRTVRDHLTDAWVSLIDIDGQTWWRSVAANPHASPRHLVHQARAAGQLETVSKRDVPAIGRDCN